MDDIAKEAPRRRGRPKKTLLAVPAVQETRIPDPAEAAVSAFRTRDEARKKFLADSKKSVRIVGFEALPYVRRKHMGYSEVRILARSDLREIVYSRIIDPRMRTSEAVKLAGLDETQSAEEAKRRGWKF